MLSFELYLLQLFLYLNLILLTWRKIVTLLLRVMAIRFVRVTRNWLVHVTRYVLIRAWVLSTEESSLCHTFCGWVYDASLLLWRWTLRLGKMHDSLFHALVGDWSWGTWVASIALMFRILHLVCQGLLELHLVLHFLLLVRQNRMFTLTLIIHCRHFLFLGIWWTIWLNHSANELSWGTTYLMFGRWALNWVCHRSWVSSLKVLRLGIKASTHI